ncbi:hypothetical protein EQV77_08210 [Halobacillus fulvus]|nr:hypothetical protein EQV77_08210 [Halobacillus fulvus]
MSFWEEEVTIKREHNTKTTWAYYIFTGFLTLLAIFCLVLSVKMSLDIHWALGLLPLSGAALLLLVVAGLIRSPQEKYTLQYQFRPDGFYEYLHLPDKKMKEEQLIPYEQIERVYIGRVSQLSGGDDYSEMRAVPAVVVHWMEGESKHYRLISVVYDQLIKILSMLPDHFPIEATKYDLAPLNNATVGFLLEEDELIPISKQPFVFPYELGNVRRKSIPLWEPSNMKQKRVEKTKRLRQRGNRLFYGILGFVFLSGMLWLPHLNFEEGWLDNVWLVVTILSLFAVLGYFMYLHENEKLWRKALMLVKHTVFTLLAYLGGGLAGAILFYPSDEIVGASVDNAVVAVLAVWLTYVLVKIGKVTYVMGGALLKYAGVTPSELRKSMEKDAS